MNDRLERALDGTLEEGEDARLAQELKGDPALARELLDRARDEALLRELVPAARVAAPAPKSEPSPRWRILSMTAAALAFGLIFYGILVAPRATPAAPQDEFARQIEKLGSADPAEREAALETLKKTPIAKLPALERHLDSPDAEVRSRVHEAVAAALRSALARPVVKVELRALAPGTLSKGWKKGQKAPDGYEAVPMGEDEILVATPAVIAREQVKADSVKLAEAAVSSGAATQVQFAATGEGDTALEKMLGGSGQNGIVRMGVGAVLADGRVIARCRVLKGREGGWGLMPATKEEAGRVESALKGTLKTVAFAVTAERADAAKADDVRAALSGMLDRAAIDAGMRVSLPLDAKAPDFVAAWRALRRLGWRPEAVR
jgi:hypothetical protein